MTDQPLFFVNDTVVALLTDAELMTEWFALPANDDAQSRYQQVVTEMEYRRTA